MNSNAPLSSPSTTDLKPEAMCELVRRWYEEVLSGPVTESSARRHSHSSGSGDAEMDLGKLFAADYQNRVVPEPEGGWPRGSATAAHIVRLYRVAFPDLRITVDEQMVAGDRVITRYTAQGTHSAGAFLGVPATSRHYKLTGIAIDRIAAGRIAESWGMWDSRLLLVQMGVLPDNIAHF